MNRTIKDNRITYYRPGDAQPVAMIDEDLRPGQAILTLAGSFGNGLAFELGDELTALISTGHRVMIRASSVTYLSSAVQSQLLTAQLAMERHQGSLILVGLQPQVYQSLVASGMHELLDIRMEVNRP